MFRNRPTLEAVGHWKSMGGGRLRHEIEGGFFLHVERVGGNRRYTAWLKHSCFKTIGHYGFLTLVGTRKWGVKEARKLYLAARNSEAADSRATKGAK